MKRDTALRPRPRRAGTVGLATPGPRRPGGAPTLAENGLTLAGPRADGSLLTIGRLRAVAWRAGRTGQALACGDFPRLATPQRPLNQPSHRQSFNQCEPDVAAARTGASRGKSPHATAPRRPRPAVRVRPAHRQQPYPVPRAAARSPDVRSGRNTRNVLPAPGELSTSTRPSCAVTIPCTIARPSPVPPPTSFVV